jgi:hypothetical protein
VGANAKDLVQEQARLMGVPIVKHSFLTELFSRGVAGVSEQIRNHTIEDIVSQLEAGATTPDLSNRKKRKSLLVLNETKPWIQEKRRKSLESTGSIFARHF